MGKLVLDWNKFLTNFNKFLNKSSFFVRYLSDTSDQYRGADEQQHLASVSPQPPTSTSTNDITSTSNNNSTKLTSQQKPSGPKRINFPHDNHLALNHQPRTQTSSFDTRLNEFLLKHNIDAQSRHLILSEDFNYETFVHDLDRTELWRIGLKCVLFICCDKN